ncbi:MAG: NIPSNAP family protein [Acidocella sp. 20-63-7]|nr:MAG: NIPSNAP family protein [Acidocella sp. 20-63-7]HQT45676.1 NIPSNAP family protein [Acidocella sp.]
MIVDMRIYTCHPGRMADWVALYEAEAWPLQKQYLGKCLGWYTSIEGKLHQIVHLWGYENQGDREARRSAMVQDPAWKAFMVKANALGAFVSQENSILKPAAFAE